MEEDPRLVAPHIYVARDALGDIDDHDSSLDSATECVEEPPHHRGIPATEGLQDYASETGEGEHGLDDLLGDAREELEHGYVRVKGWAGDEGFRFVGASYRSLMVADLNACIG